VIVGDDFIVSSMPNAGTPLGVQRYVVEWAETLETAAAFAVHSILRRYTGWYDGNG